MNVLLRGIHCSPRARFRKEEESQQQVRRRRALRRVDRELEKGNFKTALCLVKQLQGKPGGLRGFGAAKLVSRRISTVDELELNEAEKMSLQFLVDSIVHSVKCCMQFAQEDDEEEKAEEQVGHENLIHGDYSASLSNDRVMCLQHEAGHFVVGYLLGVLPKRYRVPSMEDLMKDNFARGKVEFVGFEFLREVPTATILSTKFINRKRRDEVYRGIISSKTLKSFLCVILGGLTAEHLMFGYSELLHSDVEKLDSVLKWLGLCTDEAFSQVKWAGMNTALILRQQHAATSSVAEAMASGRSIGFCIDTIEGALDKGSIAQITKMMVGMKLPNFELE